MGKFLTEAEANMYMAQHCQFCAHGPLCIITSLHVAHGNASELIQSVLDSLIPRNRLANTKCLMFLRGARYKAIKRVGSIMVDSGLKSVMVDGEKVHLGRVLFKLLEYFVDHVGEVCSWNQLLREVWNRSWVEDGTQGEKALVRTQVRNLRRAIEKDPSEPKLLVTVKGFGYTLAM